MSSSVLRFARFYVLLLLATVLSGCASPHDHAALNQRLAELERRAAQLDAQDAVEPPHQSREEIEAEIKALQRQRAELLLRYTEKHPSVKVIDQRLEILNAQLRMLQ